MEKAKLEVSKCMKEFNKKYHRNYTMQDLAEELGVSRESLSRLSTDSAFSFVYSVAYGLHKLYPEANKGVWDFALFVEHLLWENGEYNVSVVRWFDL